MKEKNRRRNFINKAAWRTDWETPLGGFPEKVPGEKTWYPENIFNGFNGKPTLVAFLILFSSPNFSYAKGLKSRGQETEISQPHTKMYEFDFSGSEAGPDDTGESVQHALEVNPKLSVLGADRLKIVGQRVQEGILPPTPSNTRQHCIISEEKNTAFSRKLKVIVAWVKKNRLIILVIIIGSLACSLAFFYGVKAFKGYFTRPPEPFPIKGTEINSSNELNAQKCKIRREWLEVQRMKLLRNVEILNKKIKNLSKREKLASLDDNEYRKSYSSLKLQHEKLAKLAKKLEKFEEIMNRNCN